MDNNAAQIQALLDVESIKRMRARCARLLDTKRWAEWGMTFTADAVLDIPDAGLRVEGRTAIVEMVSAGMASVRSVHQLHAPEIELTGPDSAHGVWAMFDSLESPAGDGGAREIMTGYGHYVEDYVRDDGEWRIRLLRLERLRIDH